MRKKITAFISIALFGAVLFMPAISGTAAAVDVIDPICTNQNATETPTICKDNATSTPDSQNPIFGPHSVLAKVINILSVAVGVISLFVIMVNGVKLATSMGDPTGVATARGGIIYAVIAIALVAMAQFIVRYLLSRLL
jgi:hypothetical protein